MPTSPQLDLFEVSGTLHMVFDHAEYDRMKCRNWCEECEGETCWGHSRTERRRYEVRAENAEAAPAAALKAIHAETPQASEIEDWYWEDRDLVDVTQGICKPSLVVRNLSEEQRDQERLADWNAGLPIRGGEFAGWTPSYIP